MQVFPIPAGVPFQICGRFGDCRGTNCSRRHEGVDLCANPNTPLLAVDDGAVRFGTDPLGGIVAVLVPSNAPQTHYYYAHLSAVEGSARSVKAGDVIGYVGRTGDAAAPGIPTHLHFGHYVPQPVDPLADLQAAARVGAPSGGLSVAQALAIGAAGVAVAATAAWWLTRG
jgi:murein DD-endopeptidase MepM/ murein hydrolase activator NlpD